MKTQDSLVDQHCTLKNVEVFCNSAGEPYACTLNFSSVQMNSNKFYIIQLLRDQVAIGGAATTAQYYLFIKYGRVGEPGTPLTKTHANSHAATSAFLKAYRDKTSNEWGPIEKFVPKPNKYYRLEMAKIDVEEEEDHGEGDTGSTGSAGGSTYGTVCTLEPQVKDFIGMISDKKVHMNALLTFNIDTAKMPLGKISDKQIDKAYQILVGIDDILKAVESGEWEKSSKLLGFPETYARSQIIEYSNQFWRNVPYNCGRTTPPVIDSDESIQKLTELLEVIKNAEIAGKIIRRFNNVSDIYSKMCVDIKVVTDVGEKTIIEQLIYGTHAPTHMYGIEIMEMFRVSKEMPPTTNSRAWFEDLPNHRLLVHGSRMANFMGILSTGLRLPHPIQVANGSVLGRGIYFADVVTKSFNYCNVDCTNNIGFIALCEVALGDNPDLREYPHSDPLRTGQTSRIALGKTTMDDEGWTDLTTDDGFITDVKVPQGPLVARKGLSYNASFLYNEFVVFDTRQYRFKYIVKIKKV